MMQNKNKLLLFRSIFIGFFTQIISLFFSFLLRLLFIRYIGIEILGISNTITSILATLSLADFGFQISIVTRLYKPLAEGDYYECNKLLSIFKKIYYIIIIAITFFIIILLPFLHNIMKGVVIDAFVYKCYLLMGLNTIVSYFGAYKRTLLYADKKDYIAKIIDNFCNFIFLIIKILIIYYFRNFLLYVITTLIQTSFSNCIIHFYCIKKFIWLNTVKVDFAKLKIIFSDLKNIIFSKISGYIYSSTDNLVISSIIGTSAVGYFSNYTIITSALTGLVNSIFNQITPFIGQYLALKSEKCYDLLKIYTFIRWFIASIVIIPLYLLLDEFIQWWLGADYVITELKLLLCIDMYISIINTALCEIIIIYKSFKEDRNISVICAGINILTSIFFALRIGVKGVLVGTCISQFFYWILRAKSVFVSILKLSKREFFLYFFNQVVLLSIVLITLIISFYIKNIFQIKSFLFYFFSMGGICELVFLLFSYVLFRNTAVVCKLKEYLKK